MKTSRRRLVEAERFDRSSGGPRVVRLRSRGGAVESRLSLLSRANVADRVDSLEPVRAMGGPGSCATWTSGRGVRAERVVLELELELEFVLMMSERK